MGDVINLRLARKHRARAAAGVHADANRRKFGRTRIEKQQDALEKARADHVLDNARLDGAKSDDPRLAGARPGGGGLDGEASE